MRDKCRVIPCPETAEPDRAFCTAHRNREAFLNRIPLR